MMTKTQKIATPSKLKTGAWGCKVSMPVMVGEVVTVRTSAGKTWDAKIAAIVWSSDEVAICATVSLDRARPSGRAPRHQFRPSSRRACRTGGNCSSFGSGKSCGGHDCDGF